MSYDRTDELSHDNPPSTPSGEESAGGDQMGAILSSVEQQLEQLRLIQAGHEERELHLAEREREIEQAGNSLEEMREALEARQRAHDAEHEQRLAALEEERASVDQRQEQIQAQEADLASRHESLESWKRAFHDEKTQYEEWQRTAEIAQAQQKAELNRRDEELEATRARVEAELLRVEEARLALDEQGRSIQALEERACAAESRVPGLEEELQTVRTEMAETQRRLEETGGELERERERAGSLEERFGGLEEALTAAHEQAAAAAEERDRVSTEIAALREELDQAASVVPEQAEARISELESALADQRTRFEQAEQTALDLAQELEQERDAVRGELEEMREARDGLQAEVERWRQASADYEGEIVQTRSKVENLTNALTEQAVELERGATAIAMVQQQRAEMERLNNELAEAKLAADVELVQRKDERIAELTAALRQARGQTAGSAEIERLESRIAELTAERDRLRVAAENAELDASGAREALEQHVSGGESGAFQQLAERDIEVADLKGEIERLRSDLEIARNQPPPTPEDSAEVVALQARVAELEQQLEATEETGGSGEDHGQLEARLHAKAKRVATVAEHLRRRHARLRTARRLMRERSQSSSGRAEAFEQRARKMRELENQRHTLSELRQTLAARERKMVRKWARGRSMGAVTSLAVLAVIAAVLAWFAADRVFPAERAASVVLKAKDRQPGSLEPDEARRWQQWHTAILADRSFQKTLASRMEERRVEAFATLEATTDLVENQITADTVDPETITLTIAGTDTDLMTMALDVCATTLAAESRRQIEQRTATAWAVVQGERTEHGRLAYSTVNPAAIKDHRLVYASVIFGVVYLAILVLIGLTYGRLVRSKREFDQEGELFSDEPMSTSTYGDPAAFSH